jgi:histidine triad (HIT) family protein
MSEDKCTFCRIVNGKTDTDILYAGQTVVVFRDIHPQAPVHLLIVPRRHIRSVNDLTDEDRPIAADMLLVARQMAVEQGVAGSGYRLFFNVERGGGQVIFHLHMHLIAQPR